MHWSQGSLGWTAKSIGAAEPEAPSGLVGRRGPTVGRLRDSEGENNVSVGEVNRGERAATRAEGGQSQGRR